MWVGEGMKKLALLNGFYICTTRKLTYDKISQSKAILWTLTLLHVAGQGPAAALVLNGQHARMLSRNANKYYWKHPGSD